LLPSPLRHSHGDDLREPRENLVWIQKSLWESKQFKAEDCFRVTERDSWSGSPKQLGFTLDLWAKGERLTFLHAVMAGRGRGRGRGARPPPEEEWAYNGWPHSPPPPLYQPGPPPPQCGYYPPPHLQHPQPPPYHHSLPPPQQYNFQRPQHQGPRPRQNQWRGNARSQQQAQQKGRAE
jgi:hypothetical protein